MTARSSSRTTWIRRLGSVWLYGGLTVFALAVIDGVSRLPFTLPDLWYGNEMIWAFFSIVAIVAGMNLSRREEPLTWEPSRNGRRFDTLVLYTRDNCPLCDEAKATLRAYARWLPAPVEVDINEDPELFGQFTDCVPVVQIDGRVRFRGRIAEPLLRRLIEGTAPGGTQTQTGCGTGQCGTESCGTGSCSTEPRNAVSSHGSCGGDNCSPPPGRLPVQ